MHALALGLIGLVAFLHVWFCVLESFLWTTPFALKRLRMTKEQAEATRVLAQNQGLYNLFLAAGLLWALAGDPAQLLSRATFFLGCVAVAGLVGAATAARMILFLQTVPATLALAVLWLSRT